MEAHTEQTRREAIRLFSQEGISITSIRRQLGVAYNTISIWIKRFKTQGEKGLIPKYSACGRRSCYSKKIISQAIKYKGDHPLWGAPFILLKLEDDFPGKALPKARRLQQIFKQRGLQPTLSRLPKGKGSWAKQAFDRVQVDAKERLKTADGEDCCYLNFTDEYTGSDLDAFIFPLCSNYSSSATTSFGMRTLRYV